VNRPDRILKKRRKIMTTPEDQRLKRKGLEYLYQSVQALRRHDFAVSHNLIRLSLDNFDKARFRKGICDAFGLYSTLCLEKGDIDGCLYWCDIAEALATELKYDELLGHLKKLREVVEGA